MRIPVKIAFPTKTSQVIFWQNKRQLQKHLLQFVQKRHAALYVDMYWKKTFVAPHTFVLPRGEKAKQWNNVYKGLQQLVRWEQERCSPIVAVGGGACCDVTALVASLYRRGTPLVLVPTTLLSMVDAAVGGKTAVDFLQKKTATGNALWVKNMFGTFYPADEIWIFPECLDSLPQKEKRSGLAELLKVLWLRGSAKKSSELQLLSNWLNGRVPAKKILPLIKIAIREKGRIVTADPLDTKRIREQLNYGHTVAHGIEALSQGSLSHGEAVALGMCCESALVNSTFSQELESVFQLFSYPRPKFLSQKNWRDWQKVFVQDKKNKHREIAMSVLYDFGKVKKIKISTEKLAQFVSAYFRQE